MDTQYYLIHSTEAPKDFDPFKYDESRKGQDLGSKLREDFVFTIKPLGSDLTQTNTNVPEGTVFAGVIFGDGTYFHDDNGRGYGLLGDIQRLSFDEVAVCDIDGNIVIEVALSNIDNVFLPVLPPEAFGLARKPWWNDAFNWLNS